MNKRYIVIILVVVAAAVALGIYAPKRNAVTREPAPAERPAERPATSTADLGKVTEYVKTNISRLSPEKEVLGGTYYVTNVTYKDGIGTVAYEDGHVAHTATFRYSVDAAGEVAITDFKLLPEPEPKKGQPQADNFTKTGNLTRQSASANWTLVYEEPGKPALTRALVFSEESQCTAAGKTVPCRAFGMVQGDRVTVKGYDDGGVVAVSSMTKI